jgi:hypothetical protein
MGAKSAVSRCARASPSGGGPLAQFVKVRTILERVFDAVIAVDHELDPVGQRRRGRVRRLIRAEKPEEIEGRDRHDLTEKNAHH